MPLYDASCIACNERVIDYLCTPEYEILCPKCNQPMLKDFPTPRFKCLGDGFYKQNSDWDE